MTLCIMNNCIPGSQGHASAASATNVRTYTHNAPTLSIWDGIVSKAGIWDGIVSKAGIWDGIVSKAGVYGTV